MKTNAAVNSTSNNKLLALVVLLVMCSVNMFGQESKIQTTAIATTESVAAIDATESQMELVSWFMGTKQSQVSPSEASSTIATNKSGKKQFINNGLTTNRILSRTFLKKATSSQSAIA